MSNMMEIATSPAAISQRNMELALQMDRMSAMLRQDYPEHGEAELEAARKDWADELRAAAELLNPQEPATGVAVAGLPEKSSTEMIIHGIDKDMNEEQIAWILGGGEWVRMVRLVPEMAFVSYWTEKGQKRGLKDGVAWIKEEGWSVRATEPANFNVKYHMYEIDTEADYPAYHPYPIRGAPNDEDAAEWATTSTATITQTSWQSGESSGADGSGSWSQRTLPGTTGNRARMEALSTIEE